MATAAITPAGAPTAHHAESGARVLNTLLFEMQRRNAKRGLATLCISGDIGVAMCVERVQ